MPFTPRRILESGWRYTVAQFVLRLLYNRPYHFISPWKGVGVSTAVIFHYQGRVLVSLRSGNIEASGKYALVGGYLNPQDAETFGQCLSREIKEETGLNISADHFPDKAIKVQFLWHGREYIEQENYSTLCHFFWYKLSQQEYSNMQTLHETDGFKLIDSQEFEDMIKAGDLPFIDAQKAIRQFFTAHL